MMAIRNVQRISQICDGLKHIVRQLRMLSHELLLFICELFGFKEDVIWYAHFSYVMQEGAAPDQNKLLFAQPHFASQLQSQVCHALGMAFRLPVAQIERT